MAKPHPREPKPTRQELGQWFTPETVADLALSLALRHSSEDAMILDPSCGDGAFLRAAIKRGVPAWRLAGVDIDPIAIDAAKSVLPAVSLRCGDFFETGVGMADVIVGNPPYVRQERLGPEAKQRIANSVLEVLPSLDAARVETLVGRSDLAAPFVLRLLGQLRPGGVAAVVLSSAFFDSGYGAEFWALAEQVASLRMVVDAPKERWFADAAVHAVIAVFDAARSEAPVKIARLTKSTSDVAALLRSGHSLDEGSEERLAPRDAPQDWAANLRAPAAWLEFSEAAREHLVPLSDLASIRRGVTSGANDIFYLSRSQISDWNIPEDFLRPLLTARGRSGSGSIAVKASELGQFALMIDRDCDLNDYPELQRYLESFPDAGERGTLRSRQPWWSLRTVPRRVFLCKAYSDRFVQPLASTPMVADQRMYSLEPGPGIGPELLAALLNATPTALALESLGRASMGQGALEWTVGDAARLPVLDIRKHKSPGAVLSAFTKLAQRPIGKLASETAMPDRIALDEALLGSWPELASYREPLSEALALACQARHARAKAGLQ